MRSNKIIIVALLLLLSACKANVMVSQAPDVASGMEKLLIVPFQNMAAVYGENVNVRCPICGNVFMTDKIAEGAGQFLTDSLFIILEKESKFKLISPEQGQAVLSKLLAGSLKNFSDHELLIQTAHALNADVVLAGFVYRFKERVGTRYSADSPASVAFDIHLIRVADGRKLWSGQFNETQQSLSENLFNLGMFIRRNARWITAREMATSGLEDMLQSLPRP